MGFYFSNLLFLACVCVCVCVVWFTIRTYDWQLLDHHFNESFCIVKTALFVETNFTSKDTFYCSWLNRLVLWCSGYHICFTRRRSRVRTSPEPLSFFLLFFLFLFLFSFLFLMRVCVYACARACVLIVIGKPIFPTDLTSWQALRNGSHILVV